MLVNWFSIRLLSSNVPLATSPNVCTSAIYGIYLLYTPAMQMPGAIEISALLSFMIGLYMQKKTLKKA